jgi:hypothetical protein
VAERLRPPPAPDSRANASLDETPAPESSRRAVAAVEAEAPPSSGQPVSGMRAELHRFLASRKDDEGRAFLRSVVIKRLGADIEPALLDELVQLAATRCMEAKKPPLLVLRIRSWAAILTRRAIADYFEKGERDDKNLDPDVDVADVSKRQTGTDWGARNHLIRQWLAAQLGPDDFRRQTFNLMCEKEDHGWSLEELAAREGTTPSALSNRFHKLRRELAPKLSTMDDEKKRRTVLLSLFLGGFAVLAVLAVLLWHLLVPPSAPPLPPAPPAVPSATFTEPTFDQAQPPPREEKQPDKP